MIAMKKQAMRATLAALLVLALLCPAALALDAGASLWGKKVTPEWVSLPAAAFDGTAQPLLRLALSPAQLPPELQAELSHGAIEFTDAEQLYSALDSLDEYR